MSTFFKNPHARRTHTRAAISRALHFLGAVRLRSPNDPLVRNQYSKHVLPGRILRWQRAGVVGVRHVQAPVHWPDGDRHCSVEVGGQQGQGGDGRGPALGRWQLCDGSCRGEWASLHGVPP
jgi:hypothetical protein